MTKQGFLRICISLLFVVVLAVAWLRPATDVSVLFLGTGHPDIFADKPRMQTGIIVDVAGDRWLLDAGAGVMARMFDHKRPPHTVDHIFISHLHYDHCLDLDAILLLWRTGGPAPQPGQRPKRPPLTLWGADGTRKLISDLFEVAYSVDGRGRRLLKMPSVKVVASRDAGVYEGDGYRVSFQEVNHANMDCWAVKMETAKGVLVFSGDVGGGKRVKAEDNAAFAEWAKGADVLILDTLHMPPEELAKMAAWAKPKTLVLSHLNERFIPVFKHYDLDKTVALCSKEVSKVVVAEDGMELTL